MNSTAPDQELDRLLSAGRAQDALALATREIEAGRGVFAVHSYRAQALQALGRPKEALPDARQAAAMAPKSVSAHHNLAALLGDLGMADEAETAARQAFVAGGDAPETWLVLARALQGQNRLDEAEQAYRGAISRRRDYPDAVRDLAYLAWMRTGDVEVAAAPLLDALTRQGQSEPLRMALAQLLQYADRHAEAYRVLASIPLSPRGHFAAAQIALSDDPALALRHIGAARAQGVDAAPLRSVSAEALLALGRPQDAMQDIGRLRQEGPENQYAIALEAVALRLMGDDAYRRLYDYDRLVCPQWIDCPEGWSDLDSYLRDLAGALRRNHALKTHPIGQSLRGGSQTSAPLILNQDPVIRAFFQAIDRPIRRYIDGLEGDGPAAARRSGGYDIAGCWSVRLRPEGYHADHVHPQGWISSACYIEVPDIARADDRQGWLRFGQPPFVASSGLTAEHFVQPEPGKVVLFPSYMWHGTVPFGGEQERLTVAFDIVPV
ncbi:putative 2OG-Fe(II) oxygenase [Brevundimonas sp. NPDC055814]|uniref:2OG-Fe(II) oxygenase n=1 Tax=Brevundimonas olei TaxID=657642 RepID=A0ABZ2I8Y7_9CAUL